MLNLRRGFRRLLLVLSVVWAVGSGFYLWRFAPPPTVDYDAIAKEYGGRPVESPAPAPGEILSSDPNAGDPIEKYEVATPDGRTFTIDGPTPPSEELLERIMAKMDEAERPARFRAWSRSWAEIGFVPPVIAFALLESLLWAVRGFLGDKTK